MNSYQGFLGAVYTKTGPAAAFTDVSLVDTGDGLTFKISDDTQRFWDTDAPVTVEESTDGGTTWNTVAEGEYSVQYCGGRIVFDAVQTAEFRVSASAYPVDRVATMFDWQLEIELETADAPRFGDSWNRVVPTTKAGSGSCQWYWADGRFLDMAGDDEVPLVLYIDEANNIRYELYAILTGISPEATVDDVVQEEIEFTGKPVYYRED